MDDVIYKLAFGGSKLVYPGWTGFVGINNYPYIILRFDNSSYTPPTVSSRIGKWIQLSTTPSIWKLEIHTWYRDQSQEQSGTGLPFLFSNSSGDVGRLTTNCYILSSGNFDTLLPAYSGSTYLGNSYCESFDRMFANCTGLKLITPIKCSTVKNVGGMFQGCTKVEEGALAQYNWFNTYALNINNHSGTFTDCGSDTVSGSDELDQIPTGWGGRYVPPSYSISGSRVRIYTNYDAWDLGTWTEVFNNLHGMSLFTTVSVSSFAGVSMNRTRIKSINGLGTASGNALYFYPCFAQFSGTGSSAVIRGCYTTTGYNGMLTTNQGNTDMPGTLDYSTYGTFAHEFGTFDAWGGNVYFIFLVTNVPIDQWGGLSDVYGVLYNGNFRTTQFWYFF